MRPLRFIQILLFMHSYSAVLSFRIVTVLLLRPFHFPRDFKYYKNVGFTICFVQVLYLHQQQMPTTK